MGMVQMLAEFLLLFTIVHIALWILGILTERPGFVLVAIVLVFLTMSASAIVILQPVVLPVANSTATFAVKATRDPYTAFAQFLLLVWYLYTFYELSLEMEAEEPLEKRSKKRIVFVPMEWLER